MRKNQGKKQLRDIKTIFLFEDLPFEQEATVAQLQELFPKARIMSSSYSGEIEVLRLVHKSTWPDLFITDCVSMKEESFYRKNVDAILNLMQQYVPERPFPVILLTSEDTPDIELETIQYKLKYDYKSENTPLYGFQKNELATVQNMLAGKWDGTPTYTDGFRLFLRECCDLNLPITREETDAYLKKHPVIDPAVLVEKMKMMDKKRDIKTILVVDDDPSSAAFTVTHLQRIFSKAEIISSSFCDEHNLIPVIARLESWPDVFVTDCVEGVKESFGKTNVATFIELTQKYAPEAPFPVILLNSIDTSAAQVLLEPLQDRYEDEGISFYAFQKKELSIAQNMLAGKWDPTPPDTDGVGSHFPASMF